MTVLTTEAFHRLLDSLMEDQETQSCTCDVCLGLREEYVPQPTGASWAWHEEGSLEDLASLF